MANTNLSRLDQVFTLLENGASAIARKAAAKQLGDVQKRHPTELNILLSKLLPYIRHTEWETRVAGIEAIEALVEQVPIWTIDEKCGEKATDSTDGADDTLLQFDKFDVDRLLSCSETLLSSSGEEMNISLDPKDRAQHVKYQRKYLEKSLGLHSDSALNIGFSSTCLFKDEDLIVKEEQAETKSKTITKETCEVVMGKMFEKMSSREKNFAKRKAKMMSKQKSRENRKIDDKDQPARKQRKTTDSSCENIIASSCSVDEVPKHIPEPEEWTEWPFKWFYENLLDLLFNSAWESRHGACMAIRILLKRHGGTLGKLSTSQNKLRHQQSLDDLAVRLLSVIALDRFADYVSDQVVAPVRESCAQALSVVTTFMEPEYVFRVVKVLLHLRTKEEWQLRQSAIVTLQYIIAMSEEILPELLPMCLNDIMKGLYDKDGDVRSVAAKALMPTTHVLLSDHKYDEFVNKLLVVLWDSLLDYDELTASTHSVMLLLSSIISQLPREKVVCEDSTEKLTTRLWPFFLHVDEAVRKAAISTFHTVLTADQNDKLSWKDGTCSGALVNLFCSCLFEKCGKIQQQTVSAFLSCLRRAAKSSMLATVDHFSYWIMMACQPVNLAYETNVLQLFPVLGANGRNIDDQKFIGGVYPNATHRQDTMVHIMRTRYNLTKMIGTLCWHAFSCQGSNGNRSAAFSPAVFEQVITPYLSSQTSLHQTVASNVIRAVWEEAPYLKQIPVRLSADLRSSIDLVLQQNLYYAEISPHILEVQADTQAFVQALNDTGTNEKLFPQCGFSLDEVISFCSELDSKLHTCKTITAKAKEELMEQRDFIASSAEKANVWYASLDNQCKSSGSGVIVQSALCIKSLKVEATDDISAAWNLPPKLNSIIRPLMETLKIEENVAIVERAADSLSKLFGLCANRDPSPNAKLIKNMTLTLTSLLSMCPTCDYVKSEFSDNVLKGFGLTCDSVVNDGVITMLRQRSIHDSNAGKRTRCKTTDAKHIKNPVNGDTASRNAGLCLRKICIMYQKDVFAVAPMILDILQRLKNKEYCTTVEDGELKAVIQGLILLKVVFSAISDETLTKEVLSYLPEVVNLLYHKRANIRFIASNSLAALSAHRPDQVLPHIIEKVLPEFESDDFVRRKGAIEAVTSIVKEMGSDIVNYAVLLVVPLLGKMGDFDAQVRFLATSCFARLMQYIPVESSLPEPVNMPPALIEKKMHERKFLEQLFDSTALEEYPVPTPINAELRSYQQDGVKWLAFLNRYKLHGILCDDMGLGKTLQAICIMASDHFYKAKQESLSAPKKKKVSSKRLISLVVCPPTLTGHWIEETKRFCDLLDPLHYYGIPVERIKLQDDVYKHNMVVASYEVVRNDINFFSKIRWNYCVLDEGHVIRNGKSKTSQCVKSLIANHRLILTGTPIQNNVLELWSLFDFLIPGFLGTEYEFTVRYTKPILASRDAKSSSREQEMGLLAMNALHRQVLPFMLRRMKEDVLKDLPPKIIQDYYCDLSPLQMELYEDFAKSRAKKVADASIKEFDEDEMEKCATSNKTSHVFQALQYLQKVCNHPAFVLTPNHPQYTRISENLKNSNNKLKDIKNSCKLTALKQLLLDCGIGETSRSSETAIVSQHRALIFCLHRNMLDVIERDLFKPLMPTVTYLRLDGSVPTTHRFSTVSKFNNDPSIDVLLLSTKVGGLGLNLTGADTVIFVEHDWNPTTDLQAMDRAHRIGQKKVVNVYRIITRGTLEEKILGLQKFKLNLANTIVSQDNRALSSMGTNQVLDLFKVGENDSEARRKKRQLDGSSRGLKAMIDGLSDLWDQSQYDEQYNLDNFIRSMQ